MNTMTELCFLCTMDNNCVPVDNKIVFQVQYVLPEITIIKLGIPLRICSVCYESLCAFSKFKHSSVESSRRLEARIKGAQGPPLHTDSFLIVSDSTTNSEEIIIKEEQLEVLPQDIKIHLLQSDENCDYNQIKNNIDDKNVDTDTKEECETQLEKIQEVFIKEETQDQEFFEENTSLQRQPTISIPPVSSDKGVLNNYEEQIFVPVIRNETTTSSEEFQISVSSTIIPVQESKICPPEDTIKNTESRLHNETNLCTVDKNNRVPGIKKKVKNKIPKTKNKRIRDRDYCFYCKTEVLNFARHLVRNHEFETDVQKVLSLPTNSRQRKKLLATLRKKGNYINAVDKTKPVKKFNLPTTKLLPCPHCLGFYSSSHLWRHRKKCHENKTGIPVSLSVSQDLLMRNFKLDTRLKTTVFPMMRADDITQAAKRDSLICEFGARYLKNHRFGNFKTVTSRKMRELARLLIEIKKLNPDVTNLFTVLRPQNFDIIVQATKNVAKYDTLKDKYGSPTYAMNIATSLKQCCHLAVLQMLKKKNMSLSTQTTEIETDLKSMINLLESNWKFEISTHAADDIDHKENGSITEKMKNDLVSENKNIDFGLKDEEINTRENTKVKIRRGKQRTLEPWTEEQKEITKNFFANHIVNKKPPKKLECLELINKYPEELKNKNWLKIKVYIQNQYTKKSNDS